MEIKDVIKSLVQQCNIESISTKDMAKELGTLYTRVENLDGELKSVRDSFNKTNEELHKKTYELNDYKRTHVDPVNVLAAKRSELDKEKFKFEIEREYLKREVEIYKEIVRSLTAAHSTSESYYGGNNGGSYNKMLNTDKPALPNAGTAVKLGE